MDRKTFIRGMCYGGIATFALPVVRFAQVPGRGKMVRTRHKIRNTSLDALNAVQTAASGDVRGFGRPG